MLKPIDVILFATDLTPGCQQAYEFAVAMAIRNAQLFEEIGGSEARVQALLENWLAELKARRIRKGGGYYWQLKPDFKPGDWIYFTFSRDKDIGGATVLARARLSGNRLAQWQDLLETQSATSTGYHFGSRIAFDEKGHVYFGVGDRGEDCRRLRPEYGKGGVEALLHAIDRAGLGEPYLEALGVHQLEGRGGFRRLGGEPGNPSLGQVPCISHGPAQDMVHGSLEPG